MNAILTVGTILFCGHALGELATQIKLPKITGYIAAGILLNPDVLPLVPPTFPEHTEVVTDLAISFITFEVGGTLLWSRIRRQGRSIGAITLFAGEGPALLSFGGVFAVTYLLGCAQCGVEAGLLLPLALLLASLAAPTDPSATLAVAHEYKAKGPVMSAILAVAAFDDALAIVNYVVCVAVARALLTEGGVETSHLILTPLEEIGGGVAVGLLFGLLFYAAARVLRRESEGALIVVLFGVLGLCYGGARLLAVDELLAAMTLGAVTVNINPLQERIFKLLMRYTEDLIFVLFFTLSAMHLRLDALAGAVPLALLYAACRAAGKWSGVQAGARLAGSPEPVRRYTSLGLIPQGGIVVGLALLVRRQEAFAPIGDVFVGVVIGATLLNEFLGPILARHALQQAGEIGRADETAAAEAGGDGA